MVGPVVESFSLSIVIFRISAAGFGTQGDHRLRPRTRLSPRTVGSWGRLGAFVFRCALVWVVLLIRGRGIVRAFLSSPGTLASWIGLSQRGWVWEKQESKRRYHQRTQVPSTLNAITKILPRPGDRKPCCERTHLYSLLFQGDDSGFYSEKWVLDSSWVADKYHIVKTSTSC